MTQDFVALLGTKGGPAIRPGSTMPTSSLLVLGGRKIVIDCGLGVTRGLVEQGVQLRDLDVIFITHLHSDHYLELGPLLHTAWTAGLKTAVTVFGPTGLKTYWENFVRSMQADIDIRIADEGRPDLRQLVNFEIVAAGKVTDVGSIEVTAMRNRHPPLEDTFSLSFRTDNCHVVFSGDTAYLPRLSEFAKGADLLVHEAMLEEALGPLMARIGNGDDRLMKHWLRAHTLASDAARIAASGGVRALALHHLIPSDDPDFTEAHWHSAVRPHFSGPFHLGRDGLKIPL